MAQERPRVLITDKVAPEGIDLLRPVAEVDERIGISPDDLRAIIGDYDALVVRSETRVTSDILAAGEKLKVVARAGVGVDNIDVEAATTRGVIVVNSPTGNVAAAAEHTVALLLALARHVPAATASLKSGKWERSRFVGVEVRNKTLGIVGIGKVGLGVARSALGMGMRVIATDPYASPDIAAQLGIELTSLEAVLPRADFLTTHAPLTPATRGLIGERELAQLPKGARVLNVARGGLIDEAALLAALESGHIAGAALDVFTAEPPKEEVTLQLIAHPHVVATPHLGASTEEAQVTVALDVCEQVADILAGGLPRAAVNAPIILPETLKELRPYVTLVEKLGRLYTQMYPGPLQRFDLTLAGGLAEMDIRPLRAALIKGLLESVSEARVNLVNAGLLARQRGLEIVEHHSPNAAQYANLITLQSTHETESHALAGAVTWGEERIVRVDSYRTDFAPVGDILLCRNSDRPGVIGRVGTILGNANVNINHMDVGPLDASGPNASGEALMILNIETAAPAEALAAIRAVDGIRDAIAVKL
jgi:D-3-phosphoglycerate dehydrogenase / 2-oxoglutarate reductase